MRLKHDPFRGRAAHFQSSSASSSSSSRNASSASSSSSTSSADSNSKGPVLKTFSVAPHSSQLIVSPSSTSSSSTSIDPSHFGQVTIVIPPDNTVTDRQPRLQSRSTSARSSGLLRHTAARRYRHDTLQAQIHEQLLAMRELVLLDKLQHFQARDPVSEPRNRLRVKFRRLALQLRG